MQPHSPRIDDLFPLAESVRYEEVMVPLDTQQGQRLLQAAVAAGSSQYESFSGWYEPQQGGALCGIASVVSAVNSLCGRAALQQQDLVLAANGSFWAPPDRDRYGLSLEQVGHLARSTGLVTTGVRHVTSVATAFACLRYTLPQLLACDSPCRMVCNFWRDYARHRGGHFSAVAAFAPFEQPQAGHVLLMDPQRKRAPPHWLPLNVLCSLMHRLDRTSARHRGFLVLSKVPRPVHIADAIEVRLTAENEVDGVRALLQKAFAPVAVILGRPPSALEATQLQLLQASKERQLYTVLVPQQTGLVMAASFKLFYRQSLRCMYFCQFAVDPDLQSLGLGSWIVAFAESLASKAIRDHSTGFGTSATESKMSLSIYAANVRLFSFYTRLGYTVESVSEKNDAVLWLMSKLLQ